MSRWGSILKGIFHWGQIGVALAETKQVSGKAKAGIALDIVTDALGLNDLEATDPSAAAGVKRAIRTVNDGIVAAENAVGNFTHSAPTEVTEKTDEEKVERLKELEEEAAEKEAAEDAQDAERDARDLELTEKVDRAVDAAERASKAAERAAAAAEKTAALIAAPKKKTGK